MQLDNPRSKDHLWRWYERATVRKSPRRLLEIEANKLFFRPELFPASQHRLLINVGEESVRRSLILHLFDYLFFTEELEHEVVNRVAAGLAKGRYPITMAKHMQLAAYKIYIDEGYHALFSADVEDQIAEYTGVTKEHTIRPAFLNILQKCQEAAGPQMNWLVDVFFSIISETLISGTLNKIPQDTRVVTVVRNIIADHAADEAVHHVYFAGLLELMWPQLTAKQTSFIGPLLPHLIKAFLAPDRTRIVMTLQSSGLSMTEAADVYEDCYPRAQVMKSIKTASAITLRYFRQCGALDQSQVADAFGEAGFL
jgi:hypothetical protein